MLHDGKAGGRFLGDTLRTMTIALPPSPASPTPDRSRLLDAAEKLERDAAAERVRFYVEALDLSTGTGRLLDLGCGNGHAVAEWRALGVAGFGVDNALYRFGRFDRRSAAWCVVADASRLPFRTASFRALVSSGMIEHVGVLESAPPYRVIALPDRDAVRAGVVGEALRVLEADGVAHFDFPNGLFPVDFWHGDDLGAFRRHPVPDVLLPAFRDLAAWSRLHGAVATLRPLGTRLRFKKISSRWWGRALRLPVRLGLRLLDGLGGLVPVLLRERLYPYLVVAIRRDGAGASRAGTSPTAR